MIFIRNRNGYLFAGLFTAFFLAGLFYYKSAPSEEELFQVKGNVITTPYGTFENVEPLLLELIHSKAFQRLKEIDQYGVMRYVRHTPPYSRYSHSIGVWALLRLYGASLEEQIAGLLHDVSHTVFSHLGDYIFHSTDDASYQDSIHIEFLDKYGIGKILRNHGIETTAIDPKRPAFELLEQARPDVCADRIEYNLRGGMIEGLITPKDLEHILDALKYEKGRWYFNDISAAIQFSNIPLHLVEFEWLAPYSCYISLWMASAVKRALAMNWVTMEDVHFSTDKEVWKTLNEAKDPAIQAAIKKAMDYKKGYRLVENPSLADKWVRTKFMGVDPWVKLESGHFKRLTELDAGYKVRYDSVKKKLTQGWYMKMTVQP